MNPARVESDLQSAWLDEHGIVHVQVKQERADLGLAEAVDGVALVARLCTERRRPLMVNLRNVRSMNRACREYFSGPEAHQNVSATALIVSSPLTRAIGNFFMGINRVTDAKMFATEDDAVAWLKPLTR
jgi:hypothetical protein